MGVYEAGKTWQLCSVQDVTPSGYNVWFHGDPVNSFRDLVRADVSWAVCRITSEQAATDLPAGTYACDVLSDSIDHMDRRPVRLVRDLEHARPRTFLLPADQVRTGCARSKPPTTRSSASWLCTCALL